MKKLSLLIASSFFAALFLLAPNAHAANYLYYRAITVTSSVATASGTLTNFPFLVSSTISSWKPVSDGGHIQNLTIAPNGEQEPADLVFATSSANCNNATYLNFETESYVSSTGALVDWVNVPTMQTGTVIYACYGNSSVTTDQSHPSSTWNSNYVGVWHFPTENGTVDAIDSTANADNGTVTNVTATTTIIDGGGSYDGSTSWIDAGSSTVLNVTSTLTVSAWFNLATVNVSGQYVVAKDDDNGRSYDLGQADNQLCGEIGGQGCLLEGGAVPAGTWVYGTLINNGSFWSLYDDGVFVASTSQASTYSASTHLSFGKRTYPGFSEWFDGQIDEVELSKSSSTQWVFTEYNNQNAPDAAQSSNGFYVVGAETSAGGGTTENPVSADIKILLGLIFKLGIIIR